MPLENKNCPLKNGQGSARVLVPRALGACGAASEPLRAHSGLGSWGLPALPPASRGGWRRASEGPEAVRSDAALLLLHVPPAPCHLQVARARARTSGCHWPTSSSAGRSVGLRPAQPGPGHSPAWLPGGGPAAAPFKPPIFPCSSAMRSSSWHGPSGRARRPSRRGWRGCGDRNKRIWSWPSRSVRPTCRPPRQGRAPAGQGAGRFTGETIDVSIHSHSEVPASRCDMP